MKVLLSIKPEHVKNIFNGSKKFEFRRAIFKDENVQTVVVYSTLPVGRVVGEFTVKRILETTPMKLWELTKNHSGISREFFDEYFFGRQRAFAIEVAAPTLYDDEMELTEVHPSGVAPQSFCYLNNR